MYAMAIDLGGTHANCAIVSDRQVLRSRVIRISGSGKLATELPTLAQTLKELAAAESLPLSSFAGLAIGFCGLVHRDDRRVLSANAKYEDAPSLDLPAWAAAALGLPLSLENDARLALLGEHYAGTAQDTGDVVMITLGTGIGGAAMLDGRLLTGKHFQAGCLGGHLTLRIDGAPCTCGNLGCAESEASGWALPALARRQPTFATSPLANEPINFERLFHHAANGDPTATAVRDHCLAVWSANAVSLIHAYDPELLVYGGGAMHNGQGIIDHIQQYVARHAWTPWGKVQVRAAQLGNAAALHGAVPLITGYSQSRTNVR